jgi:peptide/nickel transport system substrate-binding protein
MPEANARDGGPPFGPGGLDRGPSPDAIPQIESRGFVIHANAQPHVWPWQLSFIEGSPWLDKNVRQAANLCINREELQAFSAA